MKSRDARDAMMARVTNAFAKWPRFEAMPEVSGGGVRSRVKRTPDEFGDPVITQQSYVQALVSCSYQEAEPIGRQGEFIIGKTID